MSIRAADADDTYLIIDTEYLDGPDKILRSMIRMLDQIAARRMEAGTEWRVEIWAWVDEEPSYLVAKLVYRPDKKNRLRRSEIMV